MTTTTSGPLSDAAIGQAFPHKALKPTEAFPRINPTQARQLIGLMDRFRRLVPSSPYDASPAIVVAVFKGPVVKYVVNADEAADTIANLEAAIARLNGHAPPIAIGTRVRVRRVKMGEPLSPHLADHERRGDVGEIARPHRGNENHAKSWALVLFPGCKVQHRFQPDELELVE